MARKILRIGSSDYDTHLSKHSRSFYFTQFEIRELVKAWAILSFAFAIVLGGFGNLMSFFVISALSVGVGFVLHELAHKLVAQYYGCAAEFRADNQMLFIAVLTSFFGLLFAAPGAVMIRGHITPKKNGIISLAGPVTNFALAVVFLLLAPLMSGSWQTIAQYGFTINTWLGLFNMLPFGNIDGAKILAWDKKVYAATLIAGFILFNLPHLGIF